MRMRLRMSRGGGYPPGDIIEQEGDKEEQGGEYLPGDIIEQEGVEESREDEVEEEQVADHIILNRKGRLALDETKLYTHFANRLSKCDGLNPYKMVEMWKNYRPVIPGEYQTDVLYVKPSPEVLAKVKVEKTDRSEF
jgi:hypothetical protein